MSSAMNLGPPTPEKLRLIREFLLLSGTQREIDEGAFLQPYAMPGGVVFAALPEDTTYGQALAMAQDALMSAYEPRRQMWQEEYESHANWEFTEEELEAMVAFFGSTAGQHFLEGAWRMKAYIGTNTEPFIAQIVSEACAAVSKTPGSPLSRG